MEISLAAGVGLLSSLLLATLTYTFGGLARNILTEDRAEMLESYLLIFSGCFIAYVVFSLHDVIRKGRGENLIRAHQKLQANTFDLSLFATIVLLVLREGFEIALFTASTSLFAVFLQNFLGLMIGFISASIIGLLTFMAYVKFPISKIFKITEFMIILLGASLVQNGVTKLLEHTFNIHLSNVLHLPFQFLPSENSLIGHLLQSFVGIDNEFSIIRLLIMIGYVSAIYLIFLRRKKLSAENKIHI